jgi:hypothetical protein
VNKSTFTLIPRWGVNPELLQDQVSFLQCCIHFGLFHC